MDLYKVTLKASAEKDLRKIPSDAIVRILEKLDLLAAEPFPANFVKLKGSQHEYRVRVGDYRIIYLVDLARHSVLVECILHRKDAYRKK